MKQVDIVGRRKIWFSISSALIVLIIAASFVLGVKLDIQFSGGTIITYTFTGQADKASFEKTVEDSLGQPVTLREQYDVNTGLPNYIITLTNKSGITPDQQIAVNEALQTQFPDNNVNAASISNVDPTIGRDFFLKSIVAVVAASILMIIYIAFRFRKMNGWSAVVIAVMALLHDLIIAYGAFVICGFPLNDSFIAVMLTILGYSINNTIIVYDRVRENRRLLPVKTTYKDLVNLSVNQSMTRSINTTVSTVIAVGCVCAMSLIYHVNSILTFSLPLLVGMFAGLFSSMFISGPLWAFWQERKRAQKSAS